MPQRQSTLREYLEALLIAGIFLGFTNTFVVKTFYIPSGSMEETLLVGDHLFVNRFIYGATAAGIEEKLLPLRPIERGDIVIFRSPERPTVDMVKRCVGLPGDTVEMVDKRLFINGQQVEDSSYAQRTEPRIIPRVASRRDNFGPVEVPEDRYFCLGDNRDFSNDSRFWGPVHRDLVKGKAFMVFWSFAPRDQAGGEQRGGVLPGGPFRRAR